MPIKLQAAEVRKFNNFAEIEQYVSEEEERVITVPLEKLLNNNASFAEDQYFGARSSWFRFTEDGFKSFCSVFSIPFKFISSLQELDLASKALNDYIRQSEVREKMRRFQLVVDKPSMAVLGVTSLSYRQYSNKEFIEVLKNSFPKTINEFKFTPSYVINTKLYLRVLSPDIEVGLVSGLGGTGTDVSKIGLQFCNSMVGDSAIKISFFVYRLVCANGLVMPAGGSSGKVIHSGSEDTFEKRITASVRPVLMRIKSVASWITDLNGIEYNPKVLVEAGGAKKVYDVIGLSRSNAKIRKSLKGKAITQFDIEVISKYPEWYGGDLSRRVFDSIFRSNQSMFDFINVFTEYAKKLPPRRQMEVEEKTGELAKWIIENKKKLDARHTRAES
ncbi:MAG: DUF932 domain-containing protein [Actinomycetota bacterium]|nr:DUF932 domain-containing protein [Actinomycetota bacterium]